MQNLEELYSQPGALQNLSEARRWTTARNEAVRLEASLTIVDPSGKAGRGEPVIPPGATTVRPAPPVNLRIVQ
jgi:hypothetical protein